MVRKSAGILFFRFHNHVLEYLLVHPGGPFWKNKDLGAWSIPKGEFGEEEEPLDAARREVSEELGIHPVGNFIPLSPVKQKSDKFIYAWALLYDVDPALIRSNTFEIEWPLNSGREKQFPEVDKAAWFDAKEALKKINPGQRRLIEELEYKLLA